MKSITRFIKDLFRSAEESSEQSAQKVLLEEIFNDLYRERRKIYKVNFFRGIFFGLGSALGGTLALAALVWILSFFVQIPIIGDYAKDATKSLNTSQ